MIGGQEFAPHRVKRDQYSMSHILWVRVYSPPLLRQMTYRCQ
jgi:hypothetical protein